MEGFVSTEPMTFYVGDAWGFTSPLTSRSGSITVSAVSAQLFADESTADVLSTYATGSASFTGNNITTPLVGVGSTTIIPGKYELHVRVTYNGGLKTTIIYPLEFLEEKG